MATITLTLEKRQSRRAKSVAVELGRRTDLRSKSEVKGMEITLTSGAAMMRPMFTMRQMQIPTDKGSTGVLMDSFTTKNVAK